MHIKNIHCMIEKLAECAKCEIEKGIEQVNTEEMGEVTDMLKDLCEAEYYAKIAKAMEKAEEEDKKEDEYMLKRFKEEFGEEDGEKRYYDNYRYANGRFAPKGRGSYEPRRSGRRGYEEPMYMMTPEMYHMYTPEMMRDMDRQDGRMYYSGGNSNSGSGNSSSTSSGNSGGNRYYGGNESGSRDIREGRAGQSRRSYMETKEMHKGNTPEEKQRKMKELEKYMSELSGDVTEMIEGASQEEKTMLKSKLQTLAQKIN